MADGSRYLKCDDCGAVLDRRAAGDHKHGGAFLYGDEHELEALARSLGWSSQGDNTVHFCPTCPQKRGNR